MTSVIISIGDELLIGQVVNTNAAFIAARLNSVGVEVNGVLTVPDRRDEIIRSLDEAYRRYDVIVVTGGLGPTHDDITRKAICAFFNTDLVSNDEARIDIERFLSRRNHPWSDAAEDQTLVPRIARIIPNRLGTAPGEFIERDGKFLFAMPGVPAEMEAMVDGFIVPFFEGRVRDRHILHRTLKSTGIPESSLSGLLGNLERLLGADTLAFLPSPTGVRLRITVMRAMAAECEARVQELEEYIRERAGKYIYGVNDEELEEVVGRLLAGRNLTLAVAESCTGGLIADKLTNVSGSSKYFERGVIVYSDKSKISLPGVSPSLLAAHGAVSSEVAIALARGVRELAGTSIGLSTTGIAGPTGGTPEKPVGLVWIGFSDAESSFALKFHLGEQRLRIKERAAQAAMDILRRRVLEIT